MAFSINQIAKPGMHSCASLNFGRAVMIIHKKAHGRAFENKIRIIKTFVRIENIVQSNLDVTCTKIMNYRL